MALCGPVNSGSLVHELSFLSLVLGISLLNFKQRLSLVVLVFSLSVPRIVWVR